MNDNYFHAMTLGYISYIRVDRSVSLSHHAQCDNYLVYAGLCSLHETKRYDRNGAKISEMRIL